MGQTAWVIDAHEVEGAARWLNGLEVRYVWWLDYWNFKYGILGVFTPSLKSLGVPLFSYYNVRPHSRVA